MRLIYYKEMYSPFLQYSQRFRPRFGNYCVFFRKMQYLTLSRSGHFNSFLSPLILNRTKREHLLNIFTSRFLKHCTGTVLEVIQD